MGEQKKKVAKATMNSRRRGDRMIAYAEVPEYEEARDDAE